MEQDYIIIGFSRAKGFKPFSSAIMTVEKTPYSHVYIRSYNKHFMDFDIYQASKGMVNHLVYNNFLMENEVIAEFKIPISTEKKLECINFIRQRLGKPYSLKTCIIIYLQKITKNKELFQEHLDGDKAYICSELVARVLKSNNIINLHIDVDEATPKQLFEIISNKYTREV